MALTFAGGTGSSGRHAYIHNPQGWFHLTTVLAALGIDISSQGWRVEGMQVTGISPDGTLVYGSAFHNDNVEGFVAEFPPGYLAAFSVHLTPPSDPSIVGVWTLLDNSIAAFALMSDGSYYLVDGGHGSATSGGSTSGFERGRYTWNGAEGKFTVDTLQDTTGDLGYSGAAGVTIRGVAISGGTVSVDGVPFASRVNSANGGIAGGWILGNPGTGNSSAVLIFLETGRYLYAIDGVHFDGLETGLVQRRA